MNENEIIKLLMQQIADLKAENAKLLTIIENYSKQETKVINDIKVNSYNGSTANADASTTNRNKSEHTDHCNLTTNNNNNGGL